MLTVHHLGVSQSERIHWLCEELGIAYDFKRYDRDPVTRLAPPEYKALHPLGSAPVITDGDLVLAESGAIVDYIISKYGNGRLRLTQDDPHYADYLYWFHFANGTFMSRILNAFMVSRALGSDAPAQATQPLLDRMEAAFALVEKRLGEVPYLAGPTFTAADIMNFFPLGTMRAFSARDLTRSPNTRAYISRISDRPAYRRAMAKGDPDLALAPG